MMQNKSSYLFPVLLLAIFVGLAIFLTRVSTSFDVPEDTQTVVVTPTAVLTSEPTDESTAQPTPTPTSTPTPTAAPDQRLVTAVDPDGRVVVCVYSPAWTNLDCEWAQE